MWWFLCDGNFLIRVGDYWMTYFLLDQMEIQRRPWHMWYRVVLDGLNRSCQPYNKWHWDRLPQAIHWLQQNAGVCYGPHTGRRATQQWHKAIQHPLLAGDPAHGLTLLSLSSSWPNEGKLACYRSSHWRFSFYFSGWGAESPGFTFLASCWCAHWGPLMGPGSHQSGKRLPVFTDSIYIARRGKMTFCIRSTSWGWERGRREKLVCVSCFLCHHSEVKDPPAILLPWRLMEWQR